MSKENAAKFLRDLKKNKELQSRLIESVHNDISKVAPEYGYEFTSDELQEAVRDLNDKA